MAKKKLCVFMKKIITIKKMIVTIIALIAFALSSFAYPSNQNNENNRNNIFLFVSLGMPDAVLTQYLKQAKQYHIPVVIRGLYTAKNDISVDKNIGSFSDTANRVFSLLKEEDNNDGNNNKISSKKNAMGGVLINPLLFRSFNIKVVPALVVTQHQSCVINHHQSTQTIKNTKCNSNNFDVVYGNIPIQKQLEIISEKSKDAVRAEIAKSRLNTFKSEVFNHV